MIPPPPPAPRTFDIQQAVEEGWGAFSRNWLGWLLGSFLAGCAMGLAMIMCFVPFLIVFPPLAYGYLRFTLHALDGEADWTGIFEPLQRLGEVWVPMALMVVILFLLNAPASIFSAIVGVVIDSTTDNGFLATGVNYILSYGVTMLWSFVLVRFLPAPYLIVEEGMAPLDAFTEAWNMTSASWGLLVVFTALFSVLTLIALIMCIVPVLIVGPVYYASMASVYRQLRGTGSVS